MNISSKGLDLIKKFEGLHDGDLSEIGLQPKMCPAGIWTEGYGHAMIDPVTRRFLKGDKDKAEAMKLYKVKTEKEATDLLAQDMVVYERIVSSKIHVELTQNQFDALVSHTYNTGGSATLFDIINRKLDNHKIVSWWTTKYIMGGGVVLKGLVRRRQEECDLFFA